MFYYENNLVREKSEANEYLKPKAVEGDVRFLNNLYIASFEMGYELPELLDRDCFKEKFDDLTGFKKLIYLRDPLNTLASTLSVYYKRLEAGKEVKESWVIKNIRLWVNLFEFSKAMPEGYSMVYANKYWKDSDYSREVAASLDSEKRNLDHVSRFAKGGNSFFKGKDVSSQSLEGRYKLYSEDYLFNKVLRDNYEPFSEFLSAYEEVSMVSDMRTILTR
ncbi:hypothetical protein ACYTTR_06680 [Cobetia marina]